MRWHSRQRRRPVPIVRQAPRMRPDWPRPGALDCPKSRQGTRRGHPHSQHPRQRLRLRHRHAAGGEGRAGFVRRPILAGQSDRKQHADHRARVPAAGPSRPKPTAPKMSSWRCSVTNCAIRSAPFPRRCLCFKKAPQTRRHRKRPWTWRPVRRRQQPSDGERTLFRMHGSEGFVTRGGLEREGRYLVIEGARAEEARRGVRSWLGKINETVACRRER